MTRVDFYSLPTADVSARKHFACRLVEKVFRRGHTVYLHTGSAAEAREMDDLLWTFRDDSFLPHALHATENPAAADTRIAVGHGVDPGPFHDVLVNLALDIPDFFSRFERVTEIVVEDEAIRQAKREHFRFYRDRGYPNEHHKVERIV